MAFNYDSLVTDIETWLENTSTELIAAIPTIINNTEFRLSRDLVVYGFEKSSTGNFIVGTNTITRPTDLLFPDTLYYVNTTNKKVVLKFNQLENILVQFDDTTSAGYGPPESYGVNNSTTFIIGPTPDSTYAWTFFYHAKPAALTSSNKTNWFTDYAYDLLLAGCLADGARFVLDDRQTSLVTLWEGKYKMLLDATNALDIRANRDQSRAPALQQTIAA